MSSSSYRAILRSTSIIGGAQVVGIVTGLAKMKAAALLLGPAGVGLAGLYMNLVQTAASVAALGIGTVGTRQIASAPAQGGEIAVGRTRQALFWGTMVLAAVGALLFWLSSGWIAQFVLSDETRSKDVGWLSVGVALTVAAGSQSALLTGLRRVGDLARINVVAGVTSAALGVLALWLWGTQGLVAMVLIAPMATFVFGHLYVARLGPPAGAPTPLLELAREWRAMVQIGVAFMISGLVTMLGHLVARTLVQRELGPEALGQFQAAWAIGMTYLAFVLGAMGTDFYPRLAATIHDHAGAVRLVNEQTEVALLLCAPVLLLMLGFAPWIIRLLYSSEFSPAVEILRWQLLGDVLKVISWPLGFILLAAGAGRTFVLIESLGSAVFVLGVYIGLPLLGIKATGAAFLAYYLVYLPLVWCLGGRGINFRWKRAVRYQAFGVISAALAVDLAAHYSDVLGATVGTILAVGSALGTWLRMSALTDVGSAQIPFPQLGKRITAWMTPKA